MPSFTNKCTKQLMCYFQLVLCLILGGKNTESEKDDQVMIYCVIIPNNP